MCCFFNSLYVSILSGLLIVQQKTIIQDNNIEKQFC